MSQQKEETVEGDGGGASLLFDRVAAEAAEAIEMSSSAIQSEMQRGETLPFLDEEAIKALIEIDEETEEKERIVFGIGVKSSDSTQIFDKRVFINELARQLIYYKAGSEIPGWTRVPDPEFPGTHNYKNNRFGFIVKVDTFKRMPSLEKQREYELEDAGYKAQINEVLRQNVQSRLEDASREYKRRYKLAVNKNLPIPEPPPQLTYHERRTGATPKTINRRFIWASHGSQFGGRFQPEQTRRHIKLIYEFPFDSVNFLLPNGFALLFSENVDYMSQICTNRFQKFVKEPIPMFIPPSIVLRPMKFSVSDDDSPNQRDVAGLYYCNESNVVNKIFGWDEINALIIKKGDRLVYQEIFKIIYEYIRSQASLRELPIDEFEIIFFCCRSDLTLEGARGVVYLGVPSTQPPFPPRSRLPYGGAKPINKGLEYIPSSDEVEKVNDNFWYTSEDVFVSYCGGKIPPGTMVQSSQREKLNPEIFLPRNMPWSENIDEIATAAAAGGGRKWKIKNTKRRKYAKKKIRRTKKQIK